MSSVSYTDFAGSAAENYARYFVPSIAQPVSTGLLVAADLRIGERALDVACGTGLIARHAAELVGSSGSISAVDIAPDMLEVARSTAQAADIDWRHSDATALPFPDETFDVVLCQLGLMLMTDRQAALREMHRVATPGGRIVVNTPGEIQPVFETIAGAIVDHIDPALGGFVRAVFSLPDPDTLATLLRSAGFEDVSSTTYTATLHLPTPADLVWQYITSTPMGAIVAGAPAAARAAMERQVVEALGPLVVDGGIPLDQRIALASGRR